MTTKPDPNDQRSIVKNPNHPEHEIDRQNRIKEGHPNVPPAPTPSPVRPNAAPKDVRK